MSTAVALKRFSAAAAALALVLLATAVQAHAQPQPRDSLAGAAGPASSLPQAGPRLHTRCNSGPVQLAVRTVPAFPGVRFTLGGSPFVSNADGVARITAPECGNYALNIEHPGVVLPGVRARFARWSDNIFTPRRPLLLTQPRVIEVGFEVDYLVEQTFVDLTGKPVATSRVSEVLQSNSLGSRERFVPGTPRWLAGSRIMRRSRGLVPTEILYSIREVVMNGTNVVRRAEQRFYPARTRHVRISVLLYSAVVRARDRFFGFPIGSSIEVVYPDGHTRTLPLGKDSTIVLRSLPRGTYDIRVDAPGMSPKVPIALTRDQLVELRILSYLDLALLFGTLGFVAVAMLLWRRPALRARLRSPLRGARTVAGSASSAVRTAPLRPALVRVGAAARAIVRSVVVLAGIVVLSAGVVATAFGRVVRAAAGGSGAVSALRPRPRPRPQPQPSRPEEPEPGPVVGAKVSRPTAARSRAAVVPTAQTVRHVQVLAKAERAAAKLARRVDVATGELSDAPKESLLMLAAAVARDVRDDLVAGQAAAAVGGRHPVGPQPLPRSLLERILAASASHGSLAQSGSAFKWSVSGGLVDQTRAAIEGLLNSRLDDVSLATLVVDGIELARQRHVVALGVTQNGGKVALGLWPVSNGNLSPSTLIEELAGRGLHAGEELVVIVDGSRALRQALGDDVRRLVPVGPHRADPTAPRRVPVRRRAPDAVHSGSHAGDAASGRWTVRARPPAAHRTGTTASTRDAHTGAIRARHRPVLKGARDA